MLSCTIFEILPLVFQKLNRLHDSDHASFRGNLSSTGWDLLQCMFNPHPQAGTCNSVCSTHIHRLGLATVYVQPTSTGSDLLQCMLNHIHRLGLATVYVQPHPQAGTCYSVCSTHIHRLGRATVYVQPTSTGSDLLQCMFNHIHRLGLATVCTKFEVHTITCNEDMKGNTKCKNSRFEPPFGGLRITHTVHLWLHGKCIVDFL